MKTSIDKFFSFSLLDFDELGPYFLEEPTPSVSAKKLDTLLNRLI